MQQFLALFALNLVNKYLVTFLLVIIPALALHAQDEEYPEVELTIGDTLIFGDCKGDNYSYIDLYTKTRFEETDLTYDSLSGEGFYDYFFSTGDFDIRRLPCNFAQTKCIITAVNTFTDDKGNQRMVIFATIVAGEKVAWIEAEPAFEAGEVLWRK